MREVCQDVRIQDRCWDVAVRRVRTEYYTCIKTRQVPDGVEIDADRIVNATLRVSGDVASLSGQDKVMISVANGNDIGDSGITIRLQNTANTHLIYLEKIAENVRPIGDRTSQVDTLFSAKVIAVSRFKAPQMRIDSVAVNGDELSIAVMGDELNAALTDLSINIDKDQSIGGWKNVYSEHVALNRLARSPISGGQLLKVSLSALGVKINKRPHRVKIHLETIAAGVQEAGLANPSTLEVAHLIARDAKEAKFRK
jgi:hypothetical protein